MRNALFWISLPFLVPQALYLKKDIPRFADAAGPNFGTTGSGDTRTLLMFGDSIAAGVGASAFDRSMAGRTAAGLAATASVKVEWKSVGYTGATCEQVLQRLDDAEASSDLDFLVLSVGVNDVTALTTIPAWRRSLRKLLQRLNTLYQRPTVVLCGLPPFRMFPSLPQPLRSSMQLRAYSIDEASQQVVAEFENVHFAPMVFEPSPEKFAADGYHPSEAGYDEYGRAMGALLARVDPAGRN
ncbi:MAG: SGNH/GDSL hydrolase family protein [Gammaproteobacteria bacterium]|nr:SGNH/GDSL hydrolase family protein [Gammaproteobacteria bacterium]